MMPITLLSTAPVVHVVHPLWVGGGREGGREKGEGEEGRKGGKGERERGREGGREGEAGRERRKMEKRYNK